MANDTILQMLRDLVAHKGDAEIALMNAVRQNAAAAADPEILDLFHHMLLANRFWLLAIIGSTFVLEEEGCRSPSLEALMERYRSTQRDESAWLAAATEDEVRRVLVDERIPNGRCSVAQALTQVCLHSHGHRAQCAKLLRRHGSVPPPMDFIQWLGTAR